MNAFARQRLIAACVAAVAAAAPLPTLAAPAALTSADLLRAANGRLPQFLGCLRAQNLTLVGAHRGGPLPEHPENAIATMARTGALVPVFMETDVQQTADGVLFMNHDDVLDRNTTGTGPIAQQTWAQISLVKQRDTTAQPTEYAPPLLSEMLAWADGRALLLLDVKPSTDADRLVAEVSKAKADGRVMYLAYTVAQAQALRARRPEAVVALPVFNRVHLEAAKAAGLMNDKLLAMVRLSGVDDAFIAEVTNTGATIVSGTYGGRDTPDAVYVSSKDDGAYHALAARGARLIASNRPVEAAVAMMSAPGYAAKLSTCGVTATASFA